MSDLSIAVPNAQRVDRLRASLVSGFIATFALTVSLAAAYAFANGLADANGNRLERWFSALSSNTLTERVGDRFAIGMVLNLVVGLIWAVIYANIFEPRLTGPGWRRGALFSVIPWLASIVVVFMVVDIGIFGTGIDAGPLPVLGNGVLHLVYGTVLGSLYGLEREGNRADRQANSNSEQAAAIGMIAGAIVGGIGGWVVGPSMDNIAGREICMFAGALSGAAMGTLIGSLLGLKVDAEPT